MKMLKTTTNSREPSSSDGDSNGAKRSHYKKSTSLKKKLYSAKEMRKIRSKAYLERVKENPILYQRYLEKKREYYKRKHLRKKERMLKDPVYAAEVRRKARENYSRHKNKNVGEIRKSQSEESTDQQPTGETGSTDFIEFVKENSEYLNVQPNNLTFPELLKCRQIFIARKHLQQSQNAVYSIPEIKQEPGTQQFSASSLSDPYDFKEQEVPTQNITKLHKKIKTEKNGSKLKKTYDQDPDFNVHKSSGTHKRKYTKHIKQEHPEVLLPLRQDSEFVATINKLKVQDEGNDAQLISDSLKQKVKQFMERDDISVIGESTPENSLEVSEENKTRYVLHLFSLLHQRFTFEEDIDCSFADFQKCIPSNIIKPNPQDCCLCACPLCTNPELKFSHLINLGVLKFETTDFEHILQNDELFTSLFEQLEVHAQSKQSVTYSFWPKSDNGTINSLKKKITEYLCSLIRKFKDEVLQLQSHIQRVTIQYRAARSARQEARNSDTIVALHVDWVSKAKIYQTHNQSGVIYSERTVTVHAGASWSKDEVIESASLSDSKDITSVAAWVFIQDTLKSYVDKGIQKFYIISSGQVCLYKNKNSFYLMKLFIKDYNVEFRWIYLEPWHSHGPATIVGKNLKNEIEDITTSRPATLVTNAQEVYDLVQNHTTKNLMVYSEDDITNFRMQLPALKIIPGSVNFAEVYITTNEFLVKHASDEEQFQQVSGRMIKYGYVPWNSLPPPDYFIESLDTIPQDEFMLNEEKNDNIDESNIYEQEINSPSDINIEIVTNE